MNILALDTSSSACSIALQHGDQLFVHHEVKPMQQAKLMLPSIQQLLISHGLSIKDLNAIAYGAGPGSFTGIRIASSITQGLAFPNQTPVIAVSSLAALAQTAYITDKWTSLLVALDARMDQIYWAHYEVDENGLAKLAGEEQLCSPIDLISNASQGYGVGDGWKKYQDSLISRLGFHPAAINSTQIPSAEGILRLAQQKLAKGEVISSSLALPVYLR